MPDQWVVSTPKLSSEKTKVLDALENEIATMKGWVVGVPTTKMMVEPPAPKSPPVPSRWDTFCLWLVTPMLWIELFQRLRTNPKIVDKTPLAAVTLLEFGNAQQLVQMWSHHTAAGQSLTGWITVNIALWMWANFYLVFNRANKFAVWGTLFGILMNFSVILTVMYFRYFAHV